MIRVTMPEEQKPAPTPDKGETPRPIPAPNSPFGSAPRTEAKPEYDQRSLWPSDKDGSRR
jgi:hypothetical protein